MAANATSSLRYVCGWFGVSGGRFGASGLGGLGFKVLTAANATSSFRYVCRLEAKEELRCVCWREERGGLCVCVRMLVRVCVRVCVRACVRTCVCGQLDQ
jgi:hypothetical protein